MAEEIKNILADNNDKRICVVGTTCTGKSTMLKEIPNAFDMDELIFPLLTKEENDYVCQSPWTEQVGQYMDKLVREKIKIEIGKPVFGTVVIDSDLIIYLDIDEELLKERTELRNADYENAFNMNQKIKEELSKINIPIITVKIFKEKTL